jgi:hypothetical protein
MANVSAGDCAGIALAPHGQHVTPDKSFGLLPRLVLFFGVLFDVPGGECRECAPGRAGGTTLRSGVFALMNLQPEPGGFLTRQSEGDCIRRADVEPSRAPTIVIDELVGAMAGGLNLKGKATFERGF